MPKNEVLNIEEPYVDITEDVYEKMCTFLYAYYFEKISFLELLDKFEETLNIGPPLTISDQHQAEKE